MATILELRQQRANLWEQQKTILDAADPIKGMAAEQQQIYDRMEADMDNLDQTIARLQKHEEQQARMSTSAGVAARSNPGAREEDSEKQTKDVREAFLAFLRGGMDNLRPEQRNIMQARFTVGVPDVRAAQSTSGTAGGYTVPTDLYNRIVETMKAYGGMRSSRATILRTSTGATLQIPTMDDTSNTGALVAENTVLAEQDLTFGQKSLGAYMFTSKIVRVSLQLLQDSAFDLETFLGRNLGTRIGRAVNSYLTTGTGSSQPQGVVTGSTQGKVGATGQTASIIYEDLVDLEHSVDPAYRANAEYMMHDSSLKVLKKLKDSQGRPLWVPGIAVSEPDTIMGYRYVINQDMPTMAANAKSLLFGDFSAYAIRDVLDIQMLRLVERYADYLQVGFVAFARHDGVLTETSAIKHYANSAT